MNKYVMPGLIIFMLWLTSFISPVDTDGRNLLRKIYKKYQKQSSVSYAVNFRQKFLDSDDTVSRTGICKLISEKSDTLLGGVIWIQVDGKYESYYDLGKIYQVDHTQKKITDYGSFLPAITGNVSGNLIDIDFLDPSALLKYANDLNNQISVSLESRDIYVLTIVFPDDEDLSELIKKYWIRKKDLQILKMTDHVKFMGNHQYKEWNISNSIYNKVKAGELKKYFKGLSNTYATEIFKEPTAEDFMLLPAGTIAPEFTGTLAQSDKSFSLKQFLGSYVIMDFSYMSCMPCLQSIPHLNALHTNYKNKPVKVIAVNSLDNNDKDKRKLPDFIKKHHIVYDIVLTAWSTDSLYHVKGYPALYLIDPEGKIKFTQMGYSDKISDTIQKILPRY